MKNILKVLLVVFSICLVALLVSHTWVSRGFGGTIFNDKGEPLEGALVMVSWRLRGGYEGNPRPPFLAMESKTDSSGRFSFPGWGPRLSISEFMRCDEPTIFVLRDGYQIMAVQAGGCIDSLRTISVDVAPKDMSLKMWQPKGTPDAIWETQSVLDKLYSYDMGSECIWTLIPRFYAGVSELENSDSSISPGFSRGACRDRALRNVSAGK